MLHNLRIPPKQLRTAAEWCRDDLEDAADVELAYGATTDDGRQVLRVQQGDESTAFLPNGAEADYNRDLLAEALAGFKTAAAHLNAIWDGMPDDAITGTPMDFRELAAGAAGMELAPERPATYTVTLTEPQRREVEHFLAHTLAGEHEDGYDEDLAVNGLDGAGRGYLRGALAALQQANEED